MSPTATPFFKQLTIFLGSLMISPATLLARPIENEELYIVLHNDGAETFTSWSKDCKVFGDFFLTHQDSVGGVFARYSCVLSSSPEFATLKNTGWQLHIANTAQELDLTLFFNNAASNEKPILVDNLKLPRLSNFVKNFPIILTDQEFAYWLSEYFKDAMPMNMFIPSTLAKSAMQNGGKLSLPIPPTKGERAPLLTPTPNKTIYSLAFDDQGRYWQATIIEEPNASGEEASQPQTITLTPQSITALDKNGLWLHHDTGPGTNKKTIQKNIETIFAAIANPLGENVSSKNEGFFSLRSKGYLGVRYGRYLPPLLNSASSGADLIAKSQIYSVLLESNHGIFAGWRVYFDVLPKVTAIEYGLNESLRWQRLTLGRSFGFNPGFLIDLIDITPKLGTWNFEARLPYAYDDGSMEVKSFEIKNALSAAIEVGIEKYYDDMKFRGWYARDFVYSFFKSGESVTSDRFGIDSLFQVGPMFGPVATIAILAVNTEKVRLSKSGANVDDAIITDTSYSSNTISGGFGISW